MRRCRLSTELVTIHVGISSDFCKDCLGIGSQLRVGGLVGWLLQRWIGARDQAVERGRARVQGLETTAPRGIGELTTDQSEHEAKVIGYAASKDIAVLRGVGALASKFTPLPLGVSQRLLVSQTSRLARQERAPVGFAADPSTPWRREPMWLLGKPLAIRPSFDALLERVVRNFTGIEVPKTERAEGLTVEAILTPQEAARGVEVPIAVPGIESCFKCGGTGRVRLFLCASCHGQGLISTERIVRIPVPPLVRPESIIELPLHGFGIRNLYLRLYVRIE
jgi:hypothetical protein